MRRLGKRYREIPGAYAQQDMAGIFGGILRVVESKNMPTKWSQDVDCDCL
jgi:hypothetical protein